MYICICHALTDSDVSAAEEQGAAKTSEVFHHYGVQPQCGRCVFSMHCKLNGKRHGSCPNASDNMTSESEPAARR